MFQMWPPLLLVPVLVSVCGSDIIPPHPSSHVTSPTRASLTSGHQPLTLNHLQQGQYCSIDDMFCIPANYSKFNPPLNPPGIYTNKFVWLKSVANSIFNKTKYFLLRQSEEFNKITDTHTH